MGYTERNWKDASILVCNDVNGTLDIKFSEIKEAIEKDYVVMVKKTVDGVTTFLDVHTINPTERTLKAKGWIYTATSDEAYATGEADESGEGGGGGGGVYVVTNSQIGETEEYSIDKSFNDMMNACDNGQVVMLKESADDGAYVMYLESLYISNSVYIATFSNQGTTANYYASNGDALMTNENPA